MGFLGSVGAKILVVEFKPAIVFSAVCDRFQMPFAHWHLATESNRQLPTVGVKATRPGRCAGTTCRDMVFSDRTQ